ncbi:ABC transporter type 1, transmembrane domain-containing protein [Mycena galopus ATCC 62051]|nr:ABC transporter type 1, transmembrane domain-containing protein [Mycena galopus ATCC 62051]
MDGQQQSGSSRDTRQTIFLSRISAVRTKIICALSADGRGRTQSDPETESIASTLVDRTDRTLSNGRSRNSGYRYTGRGGAGNFRAYPSPSSSPPVQPIPQHPKPVMRSTGRGGSGNIKAYHSTSEHSDLVPNSQVLRRSVTSSPMSNGASDFLVFRHRPMKHNLNYRPYFRRQYFYSQLLLGVRILAFGIILRSRCTLPADLVNGKVPRCLPRQPDLLVALKTLFGAVYVTSSVAMLFYEHEDQPQLPEIVLLSTGVATAIVFVVASISEHYHSISPSTLTSLYAVIGIVLYAYPLRALCAVPGYLHANSAATVSLFFLIFLEGKSKRGLLIPTDPPHAYESTLSFLVKPFFPHIVPILYSGWRRRITLPELQNIPLHLKADSATNKLLAALAVGDKTDRWYLAKSMFKAFGGSLLAPVLPRLVVLIGTFSQVILVEQMILYVSDKSIPKERGPLLVSAYIVVYVSLAISNYVYTEKVNACMVLYRSALTGSLYTKTLRLTSTAAREIGQGAATTYMSVDVQKVINGFQTFEELWPALVTIIVACVMLWYKAGYVMLAPLVFIVALLSTTSSISRLVGAAQGAWLKAMDLRIKLLTSALGQLLPIKLGAYEVPLSQKINALRRLETKALGNFLYYVAMAVTLSNIATSGSFLVTLAAYSVMLSNGWGNLAPLDVSRIFTLFTIVNLLNGPLNSIGQTLPQLFAALASLGRIQGFLLLPEKAESEAATVVDTCLVDRNAVAAVEESTVEVSMKGCTFAWDAKTQVLRNIRLALAPHELHMVVGSVASVKLLLRSFHDAADVSQGKSSLLMSILGETALMEGRAEVKAHKIALASQTAFIYPGTIRAS